VPADEVAAPFAVGRIGGRVFAAVDEELRLVEAEAVQDLLVPRIEGEQVFAR
jgi:hypothetical protein